MDLRHLGYSLASLSIALGMAELAAGKSLARSMGVARHSGTVRAFGVRELATGAALLVRPTASRNAWARVAGDILDLGALVVASRSAGAQRKVVWAGAAFVASALIVDTFAGWTMQAEEARHSF